LDFLTPAARQEKAGFRRFRWIFSRRDKLRIQVYLSPSDAEVKARTPSSFLSFFSFQLAWQLTDGFDAAAIRIQRTVATCASTVVLSGSLDAARKRRRNAESRFHGADRHNGYLVFCPLVSEEELVLRKKMHGEMVVAPFFRQMWDILRDLGSVVCRTPVHGSPVIEMQSVLEQSQPVCLF